MAERRGVASMARPRGKLVWMHGASVGEALALLPLVARLRASGYGVLMTTGTVTSARILAQRLPEGALHQYLPLDAPPFVKSFLANWHPDLSILSESELWPNLMLEARERGIPIVLVNARLSERSYKRWRRASRLVRELLSTVDLCLAQTDMDAERFTALGATRVDICGNLKFDAAPLPVRLTELANLRAALGTRQCWIAASTHAAEEQIILDAHKSLLGRFPRLLTILAPRHPDRGSAIRVKASAHGIRVAARSKAEAITAETQLYLCDTIGELGLLYRLDVPVFLGKSLAGTGGQNPIEPAQLGAAILHGPSVANFAAVYAELDNAGGAEVVFDGADLATHVASLFTDADARVALARRAVAVLGKHVGASERIMRRLAPYLAAKAEATV